MPQLNSEALNLVDPANSTDVALGSSAVFTGDWIKVTSYNSVTVMIAGDEIIASARIEWSDDGVTVREVQPIITDENPLSYNGSVTAHSTVQAAYRRVVVENGGTAQTSGVFVVQSQLRRGTPVGYISPLVSEPEDGDPGQTVKAVMYGRRLGDVDPQYVQVLVDDGGEIVISSGPLPTTEFDQRIPATLVSTEVTSFNPEERSSLSIYNSSTVGNMYVRLGEDVDVALEDWSWKVLPGWTWVAPEWGAEVFIAWDDDTDGFAHCSEVTGNSGGPEGAALYGPSGDEQHGIGTPRVAGDLGNVALVASSIGSSYTTMKVNAVGSLQVAEVVQTLSPGLERPTGVGSLVLTGLRAITVTVINSVAVTLTTNAGPVSLPTGYTAHWAAEDQDFLGSMTLDLGDAADDVIVTWLS